MHDYLAVKLSQKLNLIPKTGLAAGANELKIFNLLPKFVNILFVIAVIIFFFMLVVGGIRWIASGGDKAQTESAKNQITAAIVGLVIILSVYAIISLLDAFFGIKLLNLEI